MGPFRANSMIWAREYCNKAFQKSNMSERMLLLWGLITVFAGKKQKMEQE